MPLFCRILTTYFYRETLFYSPSWSPTSRYDLVRPEKVQAPRRRVLIWTSFMPSFTRKLGAGQPLEAGGGVYELEERGLATNYRGVLRARNAYRMGLLRGGSSSRRRAPVSEHWPRGYDIEGDSKFLLPPLTVFSCFYLHHLVLSGPLEDSRFYLDDSLFTCIILFRLIL